MRTLTAFIVLAACSSSPTPVAAPDQPIGAGPAAPEVATAAPAAVESPAVALTTDTPQTTVAGNSFVAPAEWTLRVRGAGTILAAPEGESFVAFYDFAEAKDADDAVTRAWTAYGARRRTR